MKKYTILNYIILFLLGFLPLLAGQIINRQIMTAVDVFPAAFINFMSFAVLIGWFFIGLFSGKLFKCRWKMLATLNFPALLAFALILAPLPIFEAIWAANLNIWSQNFYLPLVRPSLFLQNFLPTIGNNSIFFISFFLLLFSSFLGTQIGKKYLQN